jgi:MerR family transcriptional regulator, light-induced transcriptional regulator
MSLRETEHPIRVVALRTGLTPHVIRIWEKRYGAVAPARTNNNRRFYTDSDIERLILLRRATLLGRSIGQVARMSTAQLKILIGEDEAASRSNVSLVVKREEATTAAYFEKCLAAIDHLDASELASILNRASVILCRPELLEDLILPLLARIGDLWQAGSFSIVHEHLATSTLRTFVGKLAAPYEIPLSAPCLIATTPSGELHELGALAAAVTAAGEGWRVTYLGPNLPAEDILKAAHQDQARAIALSIVYSSDSPEVRKELLDLRRSLPAGITVIAGGAAAPSYAAVLKEMGAMLETDFSKFRAELQRLKSPGPA